MNYPWKHISPKDTVQILKVATLSDLDKRILVSLYQPLLGQEAVSLYLTLSEYIAQNNAAEIMLSDLLIQTGLGIKQYYEARIRLEAYGLLKVFQHKQESDYFSLAVMKPMTPSHFFADPMLKMMLTEKVGQRLAAELEDRFALHSPGLEDFQEITKSFLDVIHVDMQKMSEADNHTSAMQLKEPVLSDQAIKVDSFDWNFFIEGLNKQYIRLSSVTADIKKLVYTFHLLYGINELTMQGYVLEAADLSDGTVSGKKLTAIIQKKYLQQTRKPQAGQFNEGSGQGDGRRLKQKGFSEGEIEVILHAEQVSPYAYLKSIKQQKGGFVASSETWVLKELVEQAPLSNAVINILLNYLLVIKNAPTLEKNLAIKIANDWAQSQVNTPEDAMAKVKQLYANHNQKQTKQRPTYSRSAQKKAHARQESLPDWAKGTAETDERLSGQEAEAFRNKLKQIRNKKSGDQ
ncbi:Helicase loader DnaB [Alkalibacterium sp. AK22]|uniref:replication initiation and membrane attachment family protein n=1 Tax=Alkalibacterium sp. AK22 TaxID=1229520 RepID=UPI00045011E3|nr:DnaD domain protein [Alkalibacterium sp. AK22]EXJ22900.1 Helicase loader DnaB [Alkalibacterium sp. AK22]